MFKLHPPPPPPWKESPLSPGNPPLKTEILSSPLFENLVGGSMPLPQQKEGEGVCVYTL